MCYNILYLTVGEVFIMSSASALGNSIRVARFSHNKVKDGFKRVQRWVFDLENDICKSQLSQDLQNYKVTNDSRDWDSLAQEQANDIDGWK